MQEVNFEDALEILTLKDSRYPREAYLFVREALDHTQRSLAKQKEGTIRHVSGQELLAGIKEYAATQFGPMAMMVLQEWGIRSCSDFGDIVFNMVETGGCPVLCAEDILDCEGLLNSLRHPADPLARFLWNSFSEAAKNKLARAPTCVDAQACVAHELNRIIASTPIYNGERFAGIHLPPDANGLANLTLKGVPLAQFNRYLLELAYPRHIAKSHGLLAKTKNDTRADFEVGYDFFEAFRKPFLPPSKQHTAQPDEARSLR